jgi:integrase/recombinase XerD
MHLLQSGIAFNVIALWLGHESPNTTHRYVEAFGRTSAGA